MLVDINHKDSHDIEVWNFESAFIEGRNVVLRCSGIDRLQRRCTIFVPIEAHKKTKKLRLAKVTKKDLEWAEKTAPKGLEVKTIKKWKYANT